MDIIFLVYGLAFLVMGLVIVIRQENESQLGLADILWLLAAFGFTHGFMEWTSLWQVIRGDNPGLTLAQPAILLFSYLFLFEFGRRLVLMSLSAVARAKPASRLLSVWVYAPLLGGIIGGMAVSDQPALAMTIGSRYLAGFFGSSLAGVGFHLYWRNRLKPSMSTSELRLIRIGSQVAGGAFIAYAILGGLVVPRADWFPASVINQETFLAIFHVPVQLLRAICAVLVAVSVGVLLRVFHLEVLHRLRDAVQTTQQALADLRKLSRQNELILISAAEGILGTDIDGKVVFVNDAALSMLGFQREELIGNAIHPLVHHTTAAGKPCSIDDCPVHRTMQDHVKHRVDEDIFWRKDGSNFPVEYVSAPLYGEGKDIIGVVVTFLDIIERKLAEERLRESYQELGKLTTHLEVVREEEQKRIARELHDEMGGALAALNMKVSLMAAQIPAEMTDIQAKVAEVEKLIADGIHAMHRIVAELRPTLLDEVGLKLAIEEYVQEFERNTEIECDLHLPEEELTLDGNQSTVIFRIVQESLTNVAKHAKASRVSIILSEWDTSLMLTVRDNGKGFDLNTQKAKSFGLLGIRERAAMVGGKAQITSSAGNGTTVRANLPLIASRHEGCPAN